MKCYIPDYVQRCREGFRSGPAETCPDYLDARHRSVVLLIADKRHVPIFFTHPIMINPLILPCIGNVQLAGEAIDRRTERGGDCQETKKCEIRLDVSANCSLLSILSESDIKARNAKDKFRRGLW